MGNETVEEVRAQADRRGMEKLVRSISAGIIQSDESVTLNVHNVPKDVMLELLDEGIIDSIEQGANLNPPTGRGRIHLASANVKVIFFMERDRG